MRTMFSEKSWSIQTAARMKTICLESETVLSSCTSCLSARLLRNHFPFPQAECVSWNSHWTWDWTLWSTDKWPMQCPLPGGHARVRNFLGLHHLLTISFMVGYFLNLFPQIKGAWWPQVFYSWAFSYSSVWTKSGGIPQHPAASHIRGWARRTSTPLYCGFSFWRVGKLVRCRHRLIAMFLHSCQLHGTANRKL